jgi:hypothetical protein
LELGDRYSLEILSEYGNKIVLSTDSSKIKKTKSLLNLYPDLINKLKILEKED